MSAQARSSPRVAGDSVQTDAPRVRMQNITRWFGELCALDDVSLDIHAGQVTAVLGENGAGKSTLMNVLCGLLKPDGGSIHINTAEVRWRGPRDAIAHGVGMVHQHLHLVPTLTVAENVLLGLKEPRFLIARDAAHARLQELGQSTGLGVDPSAPVWSLTLGECQRVEILKALYRGARVLVLDEPTAVLSPLEVPPFFAALRRMAANGTAVVLITHNLAEVMSLADTITVLRHGRVVASRVSPTQTNPVDLERLILGVEPGARVERSAGRTDAREQRDARLVLTGVCTRGDLRARALTDVNLRLRPGEVVGVAGVAGNGQRELAEVVVGLRRLTRGCVVLDGVDITHATAVQRLAHGMGYVPEDRSHEGLSPSLSIVRNLFLRAHRQPGASWWVDWNRETDRAVRLIEHLDVRVRSLDQAAGELSGGNQQKLILAREMDLKPRVLVAAQPTRGLDVGASEAVRRHLLQLSLAGCAVLVISEDLDELMALSDRVVVMLKGRVVGDLPHGEATVERIGARMLGRESAA